MLGPRVAIRACCPLRMERGARPPVFWRGGPLLPAGPVLRAGPSRCYPHSLPAAKSAALCNIAFSILAVGVQAQVAKQGAPTAACRPKWPGKELLQQRAGPSGQARSSYSGVLAQVAYSKARLLQRRAGPGEWPSVAVPRAACWPKWPSEAVFLQRRAGPSALAVLAQVFWRCGLGLCWIRPSCASCEAQTSCSGSNTIVTLTETLLCLRGGRETELHHTRGPVQLQHG